MTKNLEERVVLYPEYVKVGMVNYPPGGILGPRIQPTIELVMIHRGEMTVHIDRKPFHAGTNTITILFPGHQEYFEFSKEANTIHSYIHMVLPDLSQSIKERLHRIPKTIPLSADMTSLTSRTVAMRYSDLSTSNHMLKNLASLCLWLFIGEGEQLCEKDKHITPHSIVETACRYMESHLREDLTLDQIAAAGAVCSEHLIRVFHSELNTTPITYLWERRVSLGIELLEHSGLSISMIAERCGFKTRNHFSRRVAEATGNSPKVVRQKSWRSYRSN